jgi:tetratricopeptide (TPR) repeat protein
MRPLILSHYYELGESRKQKGDTDSAIKAFAKVLELDPSYDLGKNFFYLGDYYFERGKFNECINAYQKATLEFPDSPKAKQAHFRMAKSYLESGNYKAALDEAQNFLGLYEKLDITTQTEIKWIKGQAAYNLAERALEEKNYETAVSYARMVINTGVPKVLIDDSYFILGDSYLGLEQISDAKDAYNHVLRLNPNGSGRLVEKTEQRLQKIFMGDYTIDEDVMLEENDL